MLGGVCEAPRRALNYKIEKLMVTQSTFLGIMLTNLFADGNLNIFSFLSLVVFLESDKLTKKGTHTQLVCYRKVIYKSNFLYFLLFLHCLVSLLWHYFSPVYISPTPYPPLKHLIAIDIIDFEMANNRRKIPF